MLPSAIPNVFSLDSNHNRNYKASFSPLSRWPYRNGLRSLLRVPDNGLQIRYLSPSIGVLVTPNEISDLGKVITKFDNVSGFWRFYSMLILLRKVRARLRLAF